MEVCGVRYGFGFVIFLYGYTVVFVLFVEKTILSLLNFSVPCLLNFIPVGNQLRCVCVVCFQALSPLDLCPGGSEVVCLQRGRPGFHPWVRKIPWRRKWHPTPVLSPGESHGRRSLVGCSPWGSKELDTTEQLHFLSSFLYVSTILSALLWLYVWLEIGL